MRTQYCGLVSAAYLDQIVTLCGWVHRRRDHGGVIFIDLRDREGLVQVVCDPDRAEMFQVAESVRNEFVLKITGKVRRRPAGTENAGLVSGEIEILCHDIEVLNTSATPPFQLDEENLSETTRLTHRVIDLRRPQMQKNMMLRYKTAMAFRRYLDQAGFIDRGVMLEPGEFDDLLHEAAKSIALGAHPARKPLHGLRVVTGFADGFAQQFDGPDRRL